MRVIVFLISTLIVSACASTIGPLGQKDYSTGCTESSSKSSYYRSLELSVCEAKNQAIEMVEQRNSTANRPDLFDTPLLALGSAAAGLFLFEKSPGEALEIVGLLAGTAVTYRNYYNTANIRQVLLGAANGQYCLVDRGNLVLSQMDELTRLETERVGLFNNTRLLINLMKDPAKTPDPVRAQEALTTAENALELFRKQELAGQSSNIEFRKDARALIKTSVDLLERAEVDFASIMEAIAKQAKKTSDFQLAKDAATPKKGPTDPNQTQAFSIMLTDKNVSNNQANILAKIFADLIVAVEDGSERLTKAVPAIEATVAGFDVCQAEVASITR